MQLCEACGAEMPNDALFCGQCGRKTTSENEIVPNISSTPVEDIAESPSGTAISLDDSPDTVSANEEEYQQQTSDLP